MDAGLKIKLEFQLDTSYNLHSAWCAIPMGIGTDTAALAVVEDFPAITSPG